MKRLINRIFKNYGIENIRTSQIMNLWTHLNPKPSKVKIGESIEVPMQSGKIGIFKLIDVDWNTNTDWQWYELEFMNYKD
jgi:hypothetical protein